MSSTTFHTRCTRRCSPLRIRQSTSTPRFGIDSKHKTYWRDLEQLFDYLREDLFFFASHVTVDTQQADGGHSIACGLCFGRCPCCGLLLEGGANPNTPGDLSCTPLYNAVCFGHVRCAELLLRAGALPDAANELNTTAERKALESGNPRMVALFSPAV